MLAHVRRISFALLLITVSASPVLACAGLIGPNGAVNLVRTTTLAAHHNGVEHYVTAFSFQGGGGQFGSIVPLPGIPTKVERGGDWTLQRLVRETQPLLRAERLLARAAGSQDARVILETKIDALEITILEGGGSAVGRWAIEHGFLLPPDAPEVLDFYASRSPIFMATRFDADAAKRLGQQVGEGTPIHLTIPLRNPWVPLRILALGKKASDVIRADVYLLTDIKPVLRPLVRRGTTVQHSAPASTELLRDLRADKGMEWIPAGGMWLTHLAINGAAGDLTYDLTANTTGRAQPSALPIIALLLGGSGAAWRAKRRSP